MAEDGTAAQSPPRTRRSSFAGQALADLFGSSRPSVSRPADDSSSGSPPASYPGPITTAAAQAQRRRMSLTTLGLSGSPTNQTSPFNSFRGRRESFGSSNSGSIDESAIEDGPPEIKGPDTTPASPFARRMSFGARALRDVRNSSCGGGGGTSPGQNGRSPPTSKTAHARTASVSNGTISSRDAKGGKGRGLSSLCTVPTSSQPRSQTPTSSSKPQMLTFNVSIGEGFNWSDNLRTRSERGSIAAPGGGIPGIVGQNNHSRAKSVATEAPVREMPSAPKEQKRPDHFQERILKGDFYMD